MDRDVTPNTSGFLFFTHYPRVPINKSTVYPRVRRDSRFYSVAILPPTMYVILARTYSGMETPSKQETVDKEKDQNCNEQRIQKQEKRYTTKRHAV